VEHHSEVIECSRSQEVVPRLRLIKNTLKNRNDGSVKYMSKNESLMGINTSLRILQFFFHFYTALLKYKKKFLSKKVMSTKTALELRVLKN
jgi:hypothetical protein